MFLGRVAAHKQSQVLSTSFWRGLHFLRSQGPNPDFRRSGWSHGARSARFFQDFSTLSTSNLKKFARPQVRLAMTGPAWAPSSLILGRILGSGSPLQYWQQGLEEFCFALDVRCGA